MFLFGLWNKPELHKPGMTMEPLEPSDSSHAEAKVSQDEYCTRSRLSFWEFQGQT